MDVLERLRELQRMHGWSDYRIAKEAGLAPNTVSNVYRRGNTPSLTTLQLLCKAFGITMSQFFTDGEMVKVTPESRLLLDKWVTLNEVQKEAIWHILKSYEK